MISATTSAEIKFRTTSSVMTPKYRSRTYTPRFDIEATKHNKYIEQTAPKYNYQPASYLTNDTYQGRRQQYRQNFYSSSQSYYHRYAPTSTTIQNVSYTQHTTIKTYNLANNQPFEDGNSVIKTGPTQFAYGPPEEGPIGDIIFPMLIFIGIYLWKLKLENWNLLFFVIYTLLLRIKLP